MLSLAILFLRCINWQYLPSYTGFQWTSSFKGKSDSNDVNTIDQKCIGHVLLAGVGDVVGAGVWVQYSPKRAVSSRCPCQNLELSAPHPYSHRREREREWRHKRLRMEIKGFKRKKKILMFLFADLSRLSRCVSSSLMPGSTWTATNIQI